MDIAGKIAIITVLLCIPVHGIAQRTIKPTLTGPTAADWGALAKLPDFNGVWEISRPRGPAAARPSLPSLTPEYEAKRRAYLAKIGIVYRPMRDGSNGGMFISTRLPDGTVLTGQGVQGAQPVNDEK